MKKLFLFIAVLFTASEAMALVELDVTAELEIYNPSTRETAKLQSSDVDQNRNLEGFQESVESQIVRAVLTQQMRSNACLREVMALHSSETTREAFETTVHRRIPGSRYLLPNTSMQFTVSVTQTGAAAFQVTDIRVLWRPGLVRHQRVVPVGANCTAQTLRESIYAVAGSYVREREAEVAASRLQERIDTTTVERLGRTLNLQ